MFKHFSKLNAFVNRLTTECTKQGNLYGILLTGLGNECETLFQKYIERTRYIVINFIEYYVAKFLASLFSELKKPRNVL